MTSAVSPSKSVLIFGAAGTIGKHITEVLVENKRSFDRLVVFTSDDSKEPKKSLISSWKAKGVEVIVGDVENEEQILEAYKGIDTVVCALGRAAILPQIKLIELADKTPNIKRFIPSEYGTDIEHNASSINEVPHQAKIKVRAALAKTQNIDYTYVVTGPFSDFYFGKSSKEEMGTFDVKGRKAVIVGTGDEKISFTSMHDTGKLVYTVLINPGPCSKRALKVQSYQTTQNEILAEFEKQTGAKWSVSHTSIEQLKQTEKDMYAEKAPFAVVATLRRIWVTGGTLYDKWDNEEIGAPKMESVSDTVREVIQKQEAN